MINLLDPDALSNLIAEIEGQENTQRRIDAWSAYRISRGDVLPYVTKDIKAILPQSWKQMKLSDISVSQKVIGKIAQSYKDNPIRGIEESPADSELLSEIYENADVDERMTEFDFISNLNRYSLLWVNYRAEVGLQFIPLHPFEFDVVRSKATGELEVVILNYPDSQITGATPYNSWDMPDSVNQLISNHQADSSSTTKTYAIWTKDQHVAIRGTSKIGGNGKRVYEIEYFSIEGNPQNINPLGLIPFVYFSKDDGLNFTDYPVTNPITRQTVFYNVLKSDELSAASLQGYGIRILSGTAEILNSIQRVSEGLTTAVELPQPEDPSLPKTTLTFERPGPDLEGQRASYDSYLLQVLSQNGINPSASISGQGEKFTSGLDRLIANADVQNIITKNQTGYSRVEKSAFKIVSKWLEIYGEASFSPEADFQIIFPKPQVLISDKETLENIKLRMDMGLLEPYEALMMLNPNLKEAAAKARVDEISKKKMAFTARIKTPEENNFNDLLEE